MSPSVQMPSQTGWFYREAAGLFQWMAAGLTLRCAPFPRKNRLSTGYRSVGSSHLLRQRDQNEEITVRGCHSEYGCRSISRRERRP
jgi:hypothetical protein